MGYYKAGDIWEDIGGAVGSVAQYIPVIGTGVAAAAKGITGGLKALGAYGGGSRTAGIINAAAGMVGGWTAAPLSDAQFESAVLGPMEQAMALSNQLSGHFIPSNTMLGSPRGTPWTTMAPPVPRYGRRVRARRGTRRMMGAPPSEWGDFLTGMQPPPGPGYRIAPQIIPGPQESWSAPGQSAATSLVTVLPPGVGWLARMKEA